MRECRLVALPHDAAKSAHQFGSGRPQFVVVMKRQFAQDLFAFGGKREQDLAAIVMGAGAMYKASGFQAVH